MELTRPDQIKAVLHPLRQRIIRRMQEQGPATPSEVARALGIAANKVHYHVRILEKAGIAKLVEKKQIGSVSELYFALVDDSFQVQLSRHAGSAEAGHALSYLEREMVGMVEVLRSYADQPEKERPPMFLSMEHLQAKVTERKAMEAFVNQLYERFDKACVANPGLEYRLVIGFVPLKGHDMGED